MVKPWRRWESVAQSQNELDEGAPSARADSESVRREQTMKILEERSIALENILKTGSYYPKSVDQVVRSTPQSLVDSLYQAHLEQRVKSEDVISQDVLIDQEVHTQLWHLLQEMSSGVRLDEILESAVRELDQSELEALDIIAKAIVYRKFGTTEREEELRTDALAKIIHLAVEIGRMRLARNQRDPDKEHKLAQQCLAAANKRDTPVWLKDFLLNEVLNLKSATFNWESITGELSIQTISPEAQMARDALKVFQVPELPAAVLAREWQAKRPGESLAAYIRRRLFEVPLREMKLGEKVGLALRIVLEDLGFFDRYSRDEATDVRMYLENIADEFEPMPAEEYISDSKVRRRHEKQVQAARVRASDHLLPDWLAIARKLCRIPLVGRVVSWFAGVVARVLRYKYPNLERKAGFFSQLGNVVASGAGRIVRALRNQYPNLEQELEIIHQQDFEGEFLRRRQAVCQKLLELTDRLEQDPEGVVQGVIAKERQKVELHNRTLWRKSRSIEFNEQQAEARARSIVKALSPELLRKLARELQEQPPAVSAEPKYPNQG